MKLKKHEHACLELNYSGSTLVVDPGSLTTLLVGVSHVVGIVITHEHADHWTSAQLSQLLKINPDARIFGPSGVVAAASDFEVETVAVGDRVEVGPFSLRFFGGEHAMIHKSIPLVENVGVLINDTLYYPGDSFAVPDRMIDTLAVPAGAPWLKIGESMDFVAEVAPRRAFPTHEMVLSRAGKDLSNARLGEATRAAGGEFFELEPGDTLDL